MYLTRTIFKYNPSSIARTIPDNDFIVRVSRNGGAQYTDAAMVQTGQATNGRRLYEDTVDVSGQTSPTPGVGDADIVYQIETFNQTLMRFHRTSVIWG